MVEKLPSLSHLLKILQQVPYLASKNVYRVATHFLEMDESRLTQFCNTLVQARKGLTKCVTCNCWKEHANACVFCSAQDRTHDIICVVESWQELLSIEKTRGFDGVYHVLGGVISPLDGIGPEDLAISSLVCRVQKGAKEIIFATNQTPESEATAAYIAQKLKSYPVVVTCLARGLPVGSSLESMDRVTVYKALADRRSF